MKNIIALILIALVISASTGCSDKDYDEKYLDPSKVTEVSVPNLMTGVMLRERDYSTFGYYRYFAFASQFTGKFAQTFGFAGGAAMYQPGFAAYVEGQWGNFYAAYADYAKLVDVYNSLSEAEQKANEIYKLAAQVHLYDWLMACVDMFGDMPFSEAGKLPLTMDVPNSLAKYDKAADIYSTVLDELKVCAERFTSADLVKASKFSTQDFVNSGDVTKWARYANSLRLRGAIRISQHGELTDKGKAIIKEILENPGTYPVVTTNEENIFLRNDQSGDLNFEGGGGLGDWTTCRQASGAIVDRMLSNGNFKESVTGSGTFTPGVDDPRILLLYTMRSGITEDAAQAFNYTHVLNGSAAAAGKTLKFVGIDLATATSDPGYYDDGGVSEIVQGGFFWQNRNFEHVLMTASEVLFIMAEAYHRGWGVAQDAAKAEAAFLEGVKQSIKLYYKWNEINNNAATDAVPTPSDAEIEAFAAARWLSSVNPAIPYNSADPKLDAILTQKWLHWGIFFPRQGWSEIRRTGLPKLVYPSSGGMIDWAPDRWRYPVDERTFNPNYPGLENDTYYGLLFWADPRGMRHSVPSGTGWTDQYGD